VTEGTADLAVVDRALDPVREGLEADGFRLTVEEGVAAGSVRVVLSATPDACMDCLVPDEIMVAIIERAIHMDAGLASQVQFEKRLEGAS